LPNRTMQKRVPMLFAAVSYTHLNPIVSGTI